MDSVPRRFENAAQRMLDRPRFSVSGELRQVVITALWQYLDRCEPHPAFTVDEWDDKGNRRRIVAGLYDLTVAHAAFAAAVEKWPDAKLTLQGRLGHPGVVEAGVMRG